ncbi:MAG: T9SS type A sorting domain-containing protein, partial [Gemmatimonadota bacterium]|nr:T9SS type A sorting domain-containing protein [Gemmatimonadota bacterium]
VLASGDESMLPVPAPVLYNHGPALDVSPGLINTIPRGGTAVVTVTALRFPEGATVTFTVDLLEGVGDDPQSTIEHSVDGNVLTLTAAGYVSSVVKVTASDGMMDPLEVTIQFTEQVAVELSSFVGSVVEDRVVINWTTASQTNNAGFRVLRSTDGETYEAVSELISGAGTTDQLMDYMFEDNSLPAAEIVYYVLEQIDLDGTVNLSNPIEVLLGARFILPTEFASAVYPNPFNPRTTISYELPTDTAVSVIIYDAIGQEIRQLVSQHYTAGRYSVQWDAKDHMGRSVGSGVYIAKIKAGPNTAIQKMLLLK